MSKVRTQPSSIKRQLRGHQLTTQKLKQLHRKYTSSQLANVNTYKHFLTIPSINCSSIEWILNLRSNLQSKNIIVPINPPQVYYKSILTNKIKHTSADIDQNVNVSQFQHLVLHRIGPTPSYNQLRFQTSLRTQNRQSTMHERQKKWCSTQKLDRNEQAKFIKSGSLKKKVVQPQEMETGFDGMQNYPKFTQKIVKIKNCNQYRHMMKGKVNLPTIGWQANLRSY